MILKTVVGIIFISVISFAQPAFKNQAIEDILKLPENQINLLQASLVLAKDFYPNLKEESFVYVIDYLANRFQYYFGKYTEPEDRIRAMNTYLYRKGYWNDSVVFCYDDDDLHASKLDNKFINGYLASKKGSCITMPMLYMLLGEKLGYPIAAVRSPKHFFVRYIADPKDSKFKANIEATNGGGYMSDKRYKSDVLIPDKAIKNGVYLRTLSKKEYIASLLLDNACEWADRKEYQKSDYYLSLSIKYDSTFSEAYWNYGITAFWEARQLEDELWEAKQSRIKNYYASLENEPNQPPTPVQNYQDIGVIRQNNNNLGIGESLVPKLPDNNYLRSANIPQIDNTNNNNRKLINQTLRESEVVEDLKELDKQYEKIILAKLSIYREYKKKAEDLGIVHKFSMQFFLRQAESIKKFKLNGGY